MSAAPPNKQSASAAQDTHDKTSETAKESKPAVLEDDDEFEDFPVEGET